ncbi:MAG: GNAT family N-acetyltransferase [Thermoplasmata archaeon]
MTPGDPGSAKDVIARDLRWSDYDDLRELYYLLYEERETRPDIGISLFRVRPSPADESTWFGTLYRKALTGDSIVAIAERDGHAIGSCTITRLGPSEESEMAHVAVLGILVHRDHRGSGAGTALLRRALAQCPGRFDIVRLSVFSVNVAARQLYERFGFVLVGTIPRAVRRGDREYDEDLMVLDLGRSTPTVKEPPPSV